MTFTVWRDMPAHLVALVDEVIDPAGLQQYAGGAAELMARFGGRYLFASFGPRSLEGGGAVPQAIAVAEFPDADRIQAFWHAPEYVPLRELRQRSARVRIYVADAPPAAPA